MTILNRIQSYLENGGLFNPEMMEHEKVGTLLLDIRNFILPRPIKTAPKNERVLLYVLDVQQGWQWQIGRWCCVDDYWVSEYLIQRVHPAVWMPLPSAL